MNIFTFHELNSLNVCNNIYQLIALNIKYGTEENKWWRCIPLDNIISFLLCNLQFKLFLLIADMCDVFVLFYECLIKVP